MPHPADFYWKTVSCDCALNGGIDGRVGSWNLATSDDCDGEHDDGDVDCRVDDADSDDDDVVTGWLVSDQYTQPSSGGRCQEKTSRHHQDSATRLIML